MVRAGGVGGRLLANVPLLGPGKRLRLQLTSPPLCTNIIRARVEGRGKGPSTSGNPHPLGVEFSTCS